MSKMIEQQSYGSMQSDTFRLRKYSNPSGRESVSFSEVYFDAFCAAWSPEHYRPVRLAETWNVRFENYRRHSN